MYWKPCYWGPSIWQQNWSKPSHPLRCSPPFLPFLSRVAQSWLAFSATRNVHRERERESNEVHRWHVVEKKRTSSKKERTSKRKGLRLAASSLLMFSPWFSRLVRSTGSGWSNGVPRFGSKLDDQVETGRRGQEEWDPNRTSVQQAINMHQKKD